MRAVSLKVVGGVAAVIVVGLGISLVIRDQNDARGGACLAPVSARALGAGAGTPA